MDSVRETMNIGNICRGGVMERFERALDEVYKNIDDVNRPATASYLTLDRGGFLSSRATSRRILLLFRPPFTFPPPHREHWPS